MYEMSLGVDMSKSRTLQRSHPLCTCELFRNLGVLIHSKKKNVGSLACPATNMKFSSPPKLPWQGVCLAGVPQSLGLLGMGNGVKRVPAF